MTETSTIESQECDCKPSKIMLSLVARVAGPSETADLANQLLQRPFYQGIGEMCLDCYPAQPEPNQSQGGKLKEKAEEKCSSNQVLVCDFRAIGSDVMYALSFQPISVQNPRSPYTPSDITNPKLHF